MSTDTLSTTEPSAPNEAPKATQSDKPKDPFIQFLADLATKPGGHRTLMALRASLGDREGMSPRAVPYVAEHTRVPENIESLRPALRRRKLAAERATYLLAGLFALWHTKKHYRFTHRSLGASLAVLKARGQSVAAEALMRDLTSMDQDQVGNVLIRAVTILEKQDIPVNWLELHIALQSRTPQQWREAQRRWASAYYRVPEASSS